MSALRIGVGGPVGSGKTALMDRLCKAMRDRYSVAVITNDIYTKEDAEFLTRSGALTPDRIAGVETGGCPQLPADPRGCLDQPRGSGRHECALSGTGGDLHRERRRQSGGDLLARTGGHHHLCDRCGADPGDRSRARAAPASPTAIFLVIAKIDLAPMVGADLGVVDGAAMRRRCAAPRPFVF